MRESAIARAGQAGPKAAATARLATRLAGDARTRATGTAEGLPADIAFLARRGVGPDVIGEALRRATRNGTTPSHELFAAGFDRRRYWSLLADDLGLAFADSLDGAEIASDAGLLTTEAVRLAATLMVRVGERTLLVRAPQPHEIAVLRRHLRETPALAGRIVIAAPETIRAVLLARRRAALMHYAINRLAHVMPPLSARRVWSTDGVSGTSALVAAVLALALLMPALAVQAVAVLGTALFINCTVLKVAGAVHRARPLRVEPVFERELPHYTVLVPLYREAAVARDLVAQLAGLDYPALCIKSTKRSESRSATIPRWQTRKSPPRSSASSPTFKATSAIWRSALTKPGTTWRTSTPRCGYSS